MSLVTVTLARSAGTCDEVVAGLGQRGCDGGDEQSGGGEQGAYRHHQLPQRNSAEVVCIIWSAALTTLAFIS